MIGLVLMYDHHEIIQIDARWEACCNLVWYGMIRYVIAFRPPGILVYYIHLCSISPALPGQGGHHKFTVLDTTSTHAAHGWTNLKQTSAYGNSLGLPHDAIRNLSGGVLTIPRLFCPSNVESTSCCWVMGVQAWWCLCLCVWLAFRLLHCG
jgi:hypothetical protein